MSEMQFDVVSGLEAMREAAQRMGVQGAATITILTPQGDDGLIVSSTLKCGRLFRPPNSEKPGDTGANFFSIAAGKVGNMLRVRHNSGPSPETPKGELGLRGGRMITYGDYRLFAAFSGGSSEEDFTIASVGLSAMGVLEDDDG